MNEALGLRLLASLLNWADEDARQEYAWLKFMARYKYDGYQDFVAGKRFVESLISWLRQFDTPDERRAAYEFVRRRLVYFGPAEMHHLVRLAYHEAIRPHLARAVSSRLSIPEYLVWATEDGRLEYRRALRATLFFGLSDGARIDVFRRANTGLISNEQVLVATQVHSDKWQGVLEELQKEQGADARFQYVFLLDDFTASGATLIRRDEKSGTWKGKLQRFWDEVQPYRGSHFAADWSLHVHHYIASTAAAGVVVTREADVRAKRGDADWFPRVEFTFGVTLPASLRLDDARDAAFLDLADRYYDPSIETTHTQVGGASVARGFSDGALPLVLDHNTPNNSVALLWAESTGQKGPVMRPLFRRRQRHV
jgi:hypothetical protein